MHNSKATKANNGEFLIITIQHIAQQQETGVVYSTYTHQKNNGKKRVCKRP